MGWRPAGWSVCLPLLTFPCTIKSRSSLLAPAHPGGPGKRAVKRLWCGVWCCMFAKMILMAPPPENWKRPPWRLHIMWLNTIQCDLRVYNLDLAQNRPLWRLMSTYVRRYALLVVHARKEEEDVGPLLCAFVQCLRQVLKAVHIKCAGEQCRCARIRGLQ